MFGFIVVVLKVLDSMWQTSQMTAADFLERQREAEGHAEDMPVEGEVSLIPPFCHRPVCSDSKMSS